MKAITTKFFGPTNTRGSRIKASDSDGNSVVIGYDHASHDPHREAAITLCRKMKWDGILVEGSLGTGNVYVFLSDEACINLQDPNNMLIGREVSA